MSFPFLPTCHSLLGLSVILACNYSEEKREVMRTSNDINFLLFFVVWKTEHNDKSLCMTRMGEGQRFSCFSLLNSPTCLLLHCSVSSVLPWQAIALVGTSDHSMAAAISILKEKLSTYRCVSRLCAFSSFITFLQAAVCTLNLINSGMTLVLPHGC